jgi:phosphoenolpyruvate carboxykinase (GTP)
VLTGVDVARWLEELPLIREHYAPFGDRVPQELRKELDSLEQRLKIAAS